MRADLIMWILAAVDEEVGMINDWWREGSTESSVRSDACRARPPCLPLLRELLDSQTPDSDLGGERGMSKERRADTKRKG